MVAVPEWSSSMRNSQTDALVTKGQNDTDRLLVLDLIRSLAAIIVFLSHLRIDLAPLKVPMAGLAVDLFFLLSGYIIARRYDGSINRTIGSGQFILRRIGRFYPMYAIGVLISLVSWSFLYPFSFKRMAVFQAFMLPYPAGDALYPMNGPAWSLLYELLVNFAYAIFLYKARTAVVAGLVVTSWLGLVVLGWHGYSPDGGWNHSDIAVAVCRVSASFCLGIVISRLNLAAIFRCSWGTCLVLACVTVVPCVLPVEASQFWYRYACILLVFPIAIGLAAQFRVTGRTPTVVTALAGLSFPLYAIHWPLIELVRLVSDRPPAELGFVWVSGFFAAVIALSAWINSQIDSPLQEIAKSRIRLLFRRERTIRPAQ